jgi:pilus assembly protein FimV
VADLERLQAQQAQLITMKDSELAAVQERLATTAAAGDAAPPVEAQSGGLPWAWIALVLVLVAAVAWLLIRRAPASTPRPRFDAGALAAAAPHARDPAPPASMDRVVEAPAASPATPPWHAGDEEAPVPVPAPAPTPELLPERAGAADAAAIDSINPAPGGIERIELARAYIDLGDVDTARDLLHEVARAGDADARAEASRLLEGIA